MTPPPESDLPVRGSLAIPASEIEESASRAGGPGGQNLQKNETRVTLRWSVRESAALDEGQRRRIEEKLASRLTRDGELLVHASRERSRSRNRALARERLAELVREALHTNAARRATKPTRGSKLRRHEAKKRRAGLKRSRRPVRIDDD